MRPLRWTILNINFANSPAMRHPTEPHNVFQLTLFEIERGPQLSRSNIEFYADHVLQDSLRHFKLFVITYFASVIQAKIIKILFCNSFSLLLY